MTTRRPDHRSYIPTPSAHLPWWPTILSRRISVTKRRKGPLKVATASWWLGIRDVLPRESRNRYSPDNCLPPTLVRLVIQLWLSDSCSPRRRRQSPVGTQTVVGFVALAQLFCTNRVRTPALGVARIRKRRQDALKTYKVPRIVIMSSPGNRVGEETSALPIAILDHVPPMGLEAPGRTGPHSDSEALRPRLNSKR